jgi:hypothetical protein
MPNILNHFHSENTSQVVFTLTTLSNITETAILMMMEMLEFLKKFCDRR